MDLMILVILMNQVILSCDDGDYFESCDFGGTGGPGSPIGNCGGCATGKYYIHNQAYYQIVIIVIVIINVVVVVIVLDVINQCSSDNFGGLGH